MQHARFSQVRAEAVLGSSLLVRLTFDGRPAVVKLFEQESIFGNEVRSLTRLADCPQVPRLYACGTGTGSLRLTDGGTAGYRFWLCRDWLVDGDAHRLPLVAPATFVARLDELITACTGAGLVMADAKRSNFVWNGRALCWLDFGWFTSAAPEIAERRNHDFRMRLLRRLGW